MRNFFVILSIVTIILGVSMNAQAYSASATFGDSYIGADNGLPSTTDVIGKPENFDIQGMDIAVDTDADKITVTINTNFVEGTYFEKEVKFGDLFISSNGWNPDTSTPNYGSDYEANGEGWEFVFDVSGEQLYDITSAQNLIQTSDDVMSDVSFREKQEVLIDSANLTSIGEGTFDDSNAGFNGYLVMEFDFSLLGYTPGTDLGFHWAMTCANDVIEVGYDPVPEPSTVLLIGLGLLGVFGVTRKRMKK